MPEPIVEARLSDAEEILSLQKLAYQSEAAIYSDYNIPPLVQTLEELKAEFNIQRDNEAIIRGALNLIKIHHEVAIGASAERVYEALSNPQNIGRWWDEQTANETDQGLVLEYNPSEEHGLVQLKVVDSTPNGRVEWE